MKKLGTPHNASQDWEWGREAYWMAFTAAYPEFPRGEWPSWDASIGLDGPYIIEWLNREESIHGQEGHMGADRENCGDDSNREAEPDEQDDTRLTRED
ncbi:protein kinase, partial [Marasmius crinis-equi]